MWPKVMFYGVDRDLAPKDLPRLIADQNLNLGLDRGSIGERLKVELRKGQKEGPITWWVGSVRSDGKVKEFVDFTKCFKCQRYGYNAVTYRKRKMSALDAQG